MSSLAPRLSVCLITFNNSSALRETIASILAQTRSDFELVVSDDCSRDGTWDVLQEFAATDSRVKPIRPEKNLGMAGNSNFCVAAASTPFVALLHHDDIYAPTLLEKWMQVMERHDRVAFVSNAYAVHGTDRVDFHNFDEVTNGIRALEEQLLPTWGSPVRGTALIRKSCWDAVGGMRLQFGLLADVDLWMRLARQWDIGYVNEPLIIVRELHPQDYPSGYSKWSWERMRILYEIHGVNRLEFYRDQPLKRRVEMLKLKARVGLDELYWLTYAVAKRRRDILATNHLVDNAYEPTAIRWLRRGLEKITR